MMMVIAAGSGVLLWDGTNRFNKVDWHCTHTSPVYMNITTNATDNITAVASALRGYSTTLILVAAAADDDGSACNHWYTEGILEYFFGILFGIIALLILLTFLGDKVDDE